MLLPWKGGVLTDLTTWAKRREKDLNPQSCYGSPDFKSGPVPLWHRGKTQSTGIEPVSRRNDRLLSREFQYHYGTIAKVGRVGFAPTMLKSHDFTDRCVTDSAHLPRYPSFFVLCGEGWTNTIAERWTWTINSGVWSQQATFALSRSGCGGAWTHDLSVKSRLLCQLSYTPIVQQQHNHLRSCRYRLTIFEVSRKAFLSFYFWSVMKLYFYATTTASYKCIRQWTITDKTLIEDFIELCGLLFEL